MKRRTIIILIILAAALVGGYFLLQNMQNKKAAAANNFQTESISRGSLTAVVGATGTVRANQSALLAWQTSGQIDEIKAQVGQQVAVDETLATLNTASLPQTIILAKADLVAAQQSLDTLLNSSLPQAQAKLALANARNDLDDAENQYLWDSNPRGSEDQINSAEANLVLAQNQLDNAETMFGYVDDREKDDPAYAQALLALNNARTAVDNAQANYNYLSGNTTPDVALAEAKLSVAQARLDDAEREWERLKDGPDPDDIAAAQARIDALTATISQDHITAPFAGTITEINSKPGDKVNPGTVSFRIDDFNHMLVDVEITEVDINSVHAGQQALISFDAIANKEYHGEVVEVARVGSVATGLVTFTVTIELTDPDGSVLPGMTAAVNIIIKEIENTLLVPNRSVRLLNGERVVYLLKNGVSVPTPIEIGVTSDNYSEILGGEVKEGDTVILNPVTTFNPGSSMFGR